MKRIALGLIVGLAGAGLASCGGETEQASEPRATTASPTEAPATPPAEPGCEGLPLGTEGYSGKKSPVLTQTGGEVHSQANIYGAGFDAPPAPGGGGGGVLPPVFALPDGTGRVVTFPRVTGRVNPIVGQADWNGPEGDAIGPTDVKSLQGISGIVHRTNGMFLVGMFLTDDPPSSPAPPRLDFSDTELTTPDTTFIGPFESLEPEIGQVFLIGNGKGRSYAVPDEATRLFLGFADAFSYKGCPGWYGNNRGKLNVTIEVQSG
jgi:hypothetical protein